MLLPRLHFMRRGASRRMEDCSNDENIGDNSGFGRRLLRWW